MDNSAELNNCPLTENTIRLEKDGKEIFILGTAHVSEDSRKEVEELIDSVNPDTVCVELCESRYESLQNKDRWKSLDIIKVIREGKGFLLFANMILSAFQKRIGNDMQSAPGLEMITASAIANEKGKKLVLADRDVNVTLKRAWKLSTFRDKMKILEVLLESLFMEDEKVEKEDIDNLLKGGDMFNEVMGIFADKLPKVKQVFIDERDQFLSNKIISADGKRIVAVVGKGHQNGIKKCIKSGFTYEKSIETVPPDSKISKIIPWLITGIVVLIFGLGFLKGPKNGLEMLLSWAVITGTCTAISAALVLSNPVTILSSWIVAPITTLNPFIGAGMFLALIEAYFRKPQVKDFESLPNDMTTLKGFFKNRITKILIVFVATSIGASIGTFVAIPWVGSILGK